MRVTQRCDGQQQASNRLRRGREAARVLISCVLVALLSGWAVAEPPKIVGERRADANSQLAHEQMLANRTRGRIDVFFLGDSITRRWRATDYPRFLANWDANFHGWNAANFGWGADRIENILWRVENGILDGVHPRVIVLLAGTNNLGPQPATEARVESITAGIKTLLDALRTRAPEAIILVTGILPRNDGPNPTATAASIRRINATIQTFANGQSVRYIDIHDALATPNGVLREGMTEDGLHLSLKGYQVWADALKPHLKERLGPPSAVDHAPPPTGDPRASQSKSRTTPPKAR
ncbi:MAG: GDSL-type esterase/lipase family protein [Isosphaeraceae bacterium]